MERPITDETVEQAYKNAKRWQRMGAVRLAERGMRIARTGNRSMLTALEKATETLAKFADRQSGETRRTSIVTPADRVTPTEVQLFREAYTTADRGEPNAAFQWIYAAAAWLAGLNEE